MVDHKNHAARKNLCSSFVSHGESVGRSVAHHLVAFRQWLFRRRRQFALGIYFAVIIHVCLYSQICYYHTSDSVV